MRTYSVVLFNFGNNTFRNVSVRAGNSFDSWSEAEGLVREEEVIDEITPDD